MNRVAMIAAAGALGLALLVWIVPMPLGLPSVPDPSQRPRVVVPVREKPKAPHADWPTLAVAVEKVREPAEPVVVVEGPGLDGEPPPPPPPPPKPPLNWTYEGYISEPGGMVALVRIDAAQRFLRVGDTLDDTSGAGGKVRVTEVLETAIVVDRNGEEERIELRSRELPVLPRPDLTAQSDPKGPR